MTCPTCANDLAARGRRRYCSAACKQKAWREYHALPSPPQRRPPAETVYECSRCDARNLGERRRPDCNLFTRSLGPGAPCPHCDEPIATSDIIADYQPTHRS